MKHTFVKVLSLLMALTMIMGTFVLTVSAEGVCTHTKSGDGKIVDPTCATYGYTLYECADCGETFATDIEAKLEHNFVEVEEKAPTCTETGLAAHFACEYCGEYEGDAPEVLPVTDCNYVIKITQGDCLTDGEVYEECADCGRKGATVLVFNEADGHNYVYEITDAPDCTNCGYAKFYCVDCDILFENIYVAPSDDDAAHNYVEVEIDGVCADDFTELKCTICGDRTGATGAVVEHDFQNLDAIDDWCEDNDYTVVYKAPKCGVEGLQIKKCANCDVHKAVVLEALTHDFSGPSRHSETVCTYKECAREGCDEIQVVATAHTYATGTEAEIANGLYTITNPATCTAAGEAVAKCTVAGCTSEDEVVVNALSHDVTVYSCTAGCATGECNDCTHTGRTKTCSRAATCGYTPVAAKADAHVASTDEEDFVVVAPNCVEMGYTYTACTNPECTKTAKVANSDTAIDPDTHKAFLLTPDSYVARDCLTNAKIRWGCTLCDKEGEVEVGVIDLYANYEFVYNNILNNEDAYDLFLEMTGLTETTLPEADDDEAVEEAFKASGHSGTVQAAVAPTCSATGNNEFTYCNHDYCPDEELAYAAVLEDNVVEINPDNHSDANNGVIEYILPATCSKKLEIHYNCGYCGTALHDMGERATDAHKTYVFVTVDDKQILTTDGTTPMDFTAYTSDPAGTTNGKTRIEKILEAAYSVTAIEDNTTALAPNCKTAGRHASTKCTKCDTVIIAACADTTCTHTVVEIPALGHNSVPVGANAETCTTNGNKAYTYCDRANCPDSATLSQAAVAANNVILAHGNEYFEFVPSFDPTCMYEGRIEHYICTKCNVKYAADDDTFTVITDVSVPRAGHNTVSADYYVLADGTLVPVVDYVGTVNSCVLGSATVIKCAAADCDALLTWNDFDEDGQVDLLGYAAYGDTTSEFGWYIVDFVPVEGHNFADVDYPENFEFKAGLTAVEIASLPEGLEYVNNCVEGEKYYVVCDKCGEVEDVEVLRAPGHFDADGNAIKANCKADVVCDICDTTIPKDETAHQLVEVVVKADTCTEAGIVKMVCVLCEKNFSKSGVELDAENYDDLTEVDDITTHDITAVASYVPSTSTVAGKVVLTCSRCGEVEVELPLLATTAPELSFDMVPYHPELGELDIEAGVTSNSLIAITLKVDVTDEDFTYRDLDIRFQYPAAFLEFVDVEFLLETPEILAVANKTKVNADRDDMMNTLVVRSYVTADTEDVVVVDEDTNILKIYFKVKGMIPMLDGIDFTVFQDEVKVDNDYYFATPADEAIEFAPLYDVNTDEAINGGDIVELIGMIYDAETEYVSYADLNADGAIDVLDLELLEALLLTDVTANDYVEAVYGVEFDLIATYVEALDLTDEVYFFDFDEDGVSAYDLADIGATMGAIEYELADDYEAFLEYITMYFEEEMADAAEFMWFYGAMGPDGIEFLLDMMIDSMDPADRLDFVDEIYYEYIILA